MRYLLFSPTSFTANKTQRAQKNLRSLRICGKKSTLILAIFTAVNSFAQPRYKAILPEIVNDDFYAIDLPYSVIGKCQENFADIRILDNKTQKEVAYIVKENIDERYSSDFIPFEIITEKQGKATNIVIFTAGEKINSFTLKIKNADVNKTATLQGSNDNQKWYGVKDKFLLTNNYNQNQTETLIDINFPLSNYHYYKLILNDSLSAPLNILSVGIIKNEHSREKHFSKIPIAEKTIKEKEKNTEIQLVFDGKPLISKIELYVSSPQYFSRQVKVYLPLQKVEKYSRNHKKQYSYYRDFFTQTIFSKGNEKTFAIDYNNRTDTLLLSISNGDDQPLTIDSIKVFTRSIYLVAMLQKGKSYSLLYGDTSAVLPRYDLTFAAQLPQQITHIAPLENIEELNSPADEQSPSAFIKFMKTYGIWAIILLILAQILYMVWRITKQK